VAILSVLLKRIAEELGIEAESVDEVATGAGIIKVKRGNSMDKTQRKGGAVQCLDFRHNKILIGVVVLASFGFEVDPATVKLKTSALY